jgi:hypothetical protein
MKKKGCPADRQGDDKRRLNMKIKPRKTGKKGLTKPMIENLIHNNYWMENPFKSERQRRFTWERSKDYILETFRDRKPSLRDDTLLELSYPSGTRPDAWWQYSNVHGMRKILAGNPQPVSDEMTRGKWRFLEVEDPTLVYESEFDFLKRHNLLFDGEEQAYIENLEKEKARQESLKIKAKQSEGD